MVDHDLLLQKLATARKRLRSADEIFAKPSDEFLEEEKERDLATFYLFLAVQSCIDIAAHWVASSDWGPAEEASSTFEILREKGRISEPLAEGMRSAVGLRNRIAHGYTKIDPRRLHSEYRRGTRALRDFLAAATDLVEP